MINKSEIEGQKNITFFDEKTNEYKFEDSKISEKLFKHHNEKISKRSYNER